MNGDSIVFCFFLNPAGIACIIILLNMNVTKSWLNSYLSG